MFGSVIRIIILILCMSVFVISALAATTPAASNSVQGGVQEEKQNIQNPNPSPSAVPVNPQDAGKVVTFLILGIILGAIGQGARAVIGIKNDQAQSGKNWDDWIKEHFSMQTLMISLLIGGIAGGVAAIIFIDKPITNELLLGLIAAGYAGADFIEGVMKSRLPSTAAPSGGNLQTSNPAVSKDYNHG